MFRYLITPVFTVAICTQTTPAFAQKGKPAGNLPAPPPMSCNISGKILRVLQDKKATPGTVCSKYPCYATVLVSEVLQCGSSTPLSLSSGDTVKIKFAYTLYPAAKVFPVSGAQLPGLQKGNRFTANVTEKLKTGSGVELIIYDYKVIH